MSDRIINGVTYRERIVARYATAIQVWRDNDETELTEREKVLLACIGELAKRVDESEEYRDLRRILQHSADKAGLEVELRDPEHAMRERLRVAS